MTWSSDEDFLVTDNVHMIDDGCYICQPNNPNAAEEGCSDCELSWEMYVEEVLA